LIITHYNNNIDYWEKNLKALPLPSADWLAKAGNCIVTALLPKQHN